MTLTDSSLRLLCGWKRFSLLLCRSAYYANINSLVVLQTKTDVSKCSWQSCHQGFGTSSIVCYRKNMDKKVDLKEKPKQASVNLVQVFDSNNLLIGKMTKLQANDLVAKKGNLKLVLLKGDKAEIAPSYKLMTGKEMYEEEIRQRKDSQIEKCQQEKRFKIKLSITDRDLVIKLQHVREVLQSGCIANFHLYNTNRTVNEEQAAEMQNALFKKITGEFSEIADIKRTRKTPNMTFALTLRRKSDEL